MNPFCVCLHVLIFSFHMMNSCAVIYMGDKNKRKHVLTTAFTHNIVNYSDLLVVSNYKTYSNSNSNSTLVYIDFPVRFFAL